MNERNELEEKDIVVDREIQVEDYNPERIVVYLETWFDVDKKFGLNINDDEDTWLNLYATYNPFKDTLDMKYYIDSSKDVKEYEYVPTDTEKELIKKLITDKIRQEYGQTPMELCQEFMVKENELKMGGII